MISNGRRSVPATLAFLSLLVIAPSSPAWGEESNERRTRTSAPVPIHRPEPQYSDYARREGIGGSALVEYVITEQGSVSGVEIVRPIGYELDEEALKAVARWRFKPAKKGDTPVAVTARVEVNFRWSAKNAESPLGAQYLNLMYATKQIEAGKDVESAIKLIQKNAEQGHPGSMYALARLYELGRGVSVNQALSREWIDKAAEAGHGQAIYDRHRQALQSDPANPSLREHLESAALHGSIQAQYLLASVLEREATTPKQLRRAGYFYQLCAANGTLVCQRKGGELLLKLKDTSSFFRDLGLAYLEIASAQGDSEARMAWDRESASITEGERKRIDSLRAKVIAPGAPQ
jgi:TonB family protein